MSAALNRVGNNVNQVARRPNEAKVRGERPPCTAASHAEIQELFRARRRAPDLEVTRALAGLMARIDSARLGAALFDHD